MNEERLNRLSRPLLPIVVTVPMMAEAVTAYGAGAPTSSWVPPTTFALVGLAYFYGLQYDDTLGRGPGRGVVDATTAVALGSIALWSALGLWYRWIGWESFYVDAHFGIAAILLVTILVAVLVERVRNAAAG